MFQKVNKNIYLNLILLTFSFVYCKKKAVGKFFRLNLNTNLIYFSSSCVLMALSEIDVKDVYLKDWFKFVMNIF